MRWPAWRPPPGSGASSSRPLLARDFAQALRRAAAPPPAPPAAPAAAPEQALALLGFTLAGQHYALPLERVLEVARMPAEVTGLPAADAAMAGVMPLPRRAAAAGLAAGAARACRRPDRREARIVVARIGGRRAAPGRPGGGCAAGHLRVPGEAVEPVPAVLTRGAGEARIEAIARPRRRPAARLHPLDRAAVRPGDRRRLAAGTTRPDRPGKRRPWPPRTAPPRRSSSSSSAWARSTTACPSPRWTRWSATPLPSPGCRGRRPSCSG